MQASLPTARDLRTHLLIDRDPGRQLKSIRQRPTLIQADK